MSDNTMDKAMELAKSQLSNFKTIKPSYEKLEAQLAMQAREVAMLHELLDRIEAFVGLGAYVPQLNLAVENAIKRTQATALAYEREVEAKALEALISRLNRSECAESTAQAMIEELRAASQQNSAQAKEK